MNLVSLFSGAGGLDCGFEQAGFIVKWANEYDSSIWETYRINHPHTILDTRSIISIDVNDVPNCDGIIGGPPCQSWSEAGSQKGINDKRGQLFLDFIRIMKAKQPKFFLAENVPGILAKKHTKSLEYITNQFEQAGYKVYRSLLNAYDFGVAQNRKRVFFIGIRNDYSKEFFFPEPDIENRITLHECLRGIPAKQAVPAIGKNHHNKDVRILNHEYMTGSFSSIYMSRNRVRSYDEPSFTIQAGGRHAPIHPQAPKMEYVGKNIFRFAQGKEHLYRRLTVREAAAIQGFPSEFKFVYKRVADGYKMVGNAVPVKLAYEIACEIKQYFIER